MLLPTLARLVVDAELRGKGPLERAESIRFRDAEV
jgi:hypothetical protein